ncbi:hypothetical protein DPMN_048907 [Dreissena polymorpha]|uniref:Uncharacterized protein n=1 Tax=Dreissena polymorpha TaxID=45954 RepID=A0A9D4DAE9_DREPO|nr:hypothetical protein DPMN_048907 [Dreissena polymorpha]
MAKTQAPTITRGQTPPKRLTTGSRRVWSEEQIARLLELEHKHSQARLINKAIQAEMPEFTCKQISDKRRDPKLAMARISGHTTKSSGRAAEAKAKSSGRNAAKPKEAEPAQVLSEAPSDVNSSQSSEAPSDANSSKFTLDGDKFLLAATAGETTWSIASAELLVAAVEVELQDDDLIKILDDLARECCKKPAKAAQNLRIMEARLKL